MDVRNKKLPLEEAARWSARLAAPDCSPQERAEFDRWRQSSPASAEACAVVQRVADTIQHRAGQDRRLQELTEQAYAMGHAESGRSERRQRRWAVPAALAASLLIIVLGVRLGIQFIKPPPQAIAYVNSSVQQRSITLEDGSVVHMDVGSRIKVLMTANQRHIDMLGGRALFIVTHDANRPFTVVAGAARTTALGTSFQVARTDESVAVTLAEGSVVVAGTTAAQGWQERLIPGEQLDVLHGGSSRVRRTVDSLVATSWSRGRLMFRATPLTEAVEEVNHYAVKKLRIGDPSLITLSVSGNVVTGSGELAASAFAAVLPVHIVDGGSEIILVPGHADDSQ
jgi:transmembrane sensor